MVPNFELQTERRLHRQPAASYEATRFESEPNSSRSSSTSKQFRDRIAFFRPVRHGYCPIFLFRLVVSAVTGPTIGHRPASTIRLHRCFDPVTFTPVFFGEIRDERLTRVVGSIVG